VSYIEKLNLLAIYELSKYSILKECLSMAIQTGFESPTDTFQQIMSQSFLLMVKAGAHHKKLPF